MKTILRECQCYESAKKLVAKGKGRSTAIDAILVVYQCRSVDGGRQWSRAATNVDRVDRGVNERVYRS